MRAVRSEKEEELTFFDERDCVGRENCVARGRGIRIDSPDNFFFGFFSLSFFLFFDLMERKGK